MIGTMPGADHAGWRSSKVLAGDRLACGVLDLARNLPEPEWDAFAQRCEQRPACVPAADLGLQQECGRVPA